MASPPQKAAAAPEPRLRGARVVESGGYRELHVDGRPYFIHAATFHYFRLPADQWEHSLEQHAALGINTIDLPVPWNWHEAEPGARDFSGQTNPRRDLRRLLQLIAGARLRLILRPAAAIDHWPDEGTPAWLAGAESGRRAAALHEFLAAVLREATPFAASRTVRIPDREARRNQPKEKEIGGPWILVGAPAAGLPDDPAVDVPVFVLSNGAGAAAGARAAQWSLILAPQTPRPRLTQPLPARIGLPEAEEMERAVEAVKGQRGLPAFVAQLQTGDVAPADDLRSVEVSPADALLAARLPLREGASGITYAQLQDGLQPAAYLTAAAARHFRVDAALDVNGSRLARAPAVVRTGQLMEAWSEFLGGSHERADLAIARTHASKSSERAVARLSRVAALATLATEWVDFGTHPAAALLRNPLTALVVEPGDLPLAQQEAIIEYVRRGGMLVTFPAQPEGRLLAALWNSPRDAAGVRAFGEGRVMDLDADPFAWVKLQDGFSAHLQDRAATLAIETLRGWMGHARARPAVQRSKASAAPLLMSQRVSNSGTGPLGDRASLDGMGLLSVSNLGADSAEEELDILSPRLGARTVGEGMIRLPLTIPARETLLLPLHYPLCGATRPGRKCSDEIIAAAAEFYYAERDGKQLELTFYAPVRATLRLRLEQQPSRARIDEMSVDGVWNLATREFELPILRGAAPGYIRTVKISLPYEPHVPEKPDPEKSGRRDFEVAVTDAVRLPLAPDAALATWPPLLILKGDQTGRMIVQGKNYDLMGRRVDLRSEGPIVVDDALSLDGGELGFERVNLRPQRTISGESATGFLSGSLQARSSGEVRTLPLAFLAVGKEGAVAYEYDFDRDGLPEWTLEDDHLRVLASAESGGRIVALVDKESGLSLTTHVGLLQDVVQGGSWGTRSYRAEWLRAGQPALQLTAQTADGLQISKTIRIAGKQELEARYAWTGSGLAARSLATVQSVPVTLHGDNSTRFCWQPAAAPAGETATPAPAAEMQCEVFVPLGRAVATPPGVTHLEVRTPGSFALRFEWESGRMHVEMRNYSALLRLEFPAAPAGAVTVENALRCKAVVVE